MNEATLLEAMSYPGYAAPLPPARYAALAEPCEIALTQAGCGTVERAAMFLAQIGAESGSLRWTEELASGTDYDRYLTPNGPWRGLGNTASGDGARYKGRSFIQITGRHNYGALSTWAHHQGYVPTATYFLDHPAQLAADRYAFLGPVYYWTVARDMNRYADARDIRGGTHAVNGGYNNLSGRAKRWHKCLSLRTALLSGRPVAAPSLKESDMAVIVLVDRKDCAKHGKRWPGYFLDHGDMAPRHIATAAELHTRQKQGLKQVTLPLAGFRAIGGK